MQTLIHFDIAAFFILSIILFTSIHRNMYKGTTNRMFLLLIGAALFADIFEMALIIARSAGVLSPVPLILMKTLYQLAHNFATPVYLMYVISLTGTWHKLAKNRIACVLLCLPYAADIIMFTTNLFTGWMFTFENGLEIRRTIFPIYVCALIYVVISIVFVIYHRRLFRLHQLLALASMLPLSVAAVFVKIYYPNSLVEIFSNAVGIMIMSMLIQRPEEHIDLFTGLKKYTAYANDIKKAFATDNHVTIILINIANFSSINHILGYDDSNRMLRSIGNELSAACAEVRSFPEIYYLDRGRFRVVVNSFNAKKVDATARAVSRVLKGSIEAKQIELTLEPHIVVARCPEDFGDFKALMAFGSDFHEKLKYTGEPVYASDLFNQRNFSLSNEIDDIIDRALEKGNLKVYYQPIYSIEEKRFTSAEALLRLIDDVHGFVPPDIFIPAAERTGTIHKIGSFVLDDVCRFIASDSFKELGLDYIEINLSVAQCMKGTLADEVLNTLKKYNVSPAQINLEITETAASYNQSTMTENLNTLIDAGISFSLDDFGTGYSNMDRVASLPLKIVKLDRSFVNSQHKPRMKVFLENIIKMFKEMQMEIVVEGIEDEQMVQRFSELKCDYIQGYFFSKPIPENEFVDFIKKSIETE